MAKLNGCKIICLGTHKLCDSTVLQSCIGREFWRFATSMAQRTHCSQPNGGRRSFHSPFLDLITEASIQPQMIRRLDELLEKRAGKPSTRSTTEALTSAVNF